MIGAHGYGIAKFGPVTDEELRSQAEHLRLLRSFWVSEDVRRAYSAFCMTWVTVAWAMLVGRE